jgi:hypothetical protein
MISINHLKTQGRYQEITLFRAMTRDKLDETKSLSQ